MDAFIVLSDLKRRGIVLSLEGENLRARGALTDTDRATIRQHKPGLLEALRRRSNPAPNPKPSTPCKTCGGGHWWRDGHGWWCSGCRPWPDGFTGESLAVPGGTPAPARESPVLPVNIEGASLEALRQWAREEWSEMASIPSLLAAYVRAGIEAEEIDPPSDWDRAVTPGCLTKPRGGYNPPFVDPHGEEHRVERPDRLPLPLAAVPARDAFYNHLATCSRCYAPVGRYCPEGEALRGAYRGAVAGEDAE